MDMQINPISQTDEVNTPVSTEITRDEPSISTMPVSKLDDTTEMMKILLNKFDSFDKKLDERKRDTDIQFTNLNNKFDNFKSGFNELKDEIKMGKDQLIKKCDKLITKLENLNVVENNNLCKNNSSDNEGTNKSSNTSSKIVVVEKNKNDNEIIMNDNEIFEFMKSERKLRESILVQGVQGVEFSFNVRCV